jgi:glycosyltransferase involved in cell wall biosynthesis
VRLGVISPFLDRKHGTERCIIEQLEHFATGGGTPVHIYAQRVEDLPGVVRYPSVGKAPEQTPLLWHRVASIPGPHLAQYIFWFFSNSICRRRDAKRRDLKCNLIYSPGINATDADAIAVHIVFHEFYRLVAPDLKFRSTPVREWLRLIHRRLYYRLIMALERKVYTNRKTALAAVSSLVSEQLEKYFQRTDVRVIRNGVDADGFSPTRRLSRRNSTRQQFGLSSEDFTLLLIGNDWKKKGLDALLRALAGVPDLPWKFLVVGNDVRGPYEKVCRDYGIENRVTFLMPSTDVLQFYAAADAYVGPSLEDAYGLPVLEAMACGLPVIASSHAGVSEVLRNGINGVVVDDPRDSQEIGTAVRSLIGDPNLCRQMGEQARRTAENETWKGNAQATWEWLNEVLQKKKDSIDDQKRQ